MLIIFVKKSITYLLSSIIKISYSKFFLSENTVIFSLIPNVILFYNLNTIKLIFKLESFEISKQYPFRYPKKAKDKIRVILRIFYS
ncbi:hypothetical protein LCGC14_0726230 [marine sediment metagenome]|uniref:Uncharacterized protein n=1 Tax=marine sediment metagenome TaxID=412755 RepID=A0A0F9SW56_9ZZZZ